MLLNYHTSLYINATKLDFVKLHQTNMGFAAVISQYQEFYLTSMQKYL